MWNGQRDENKVYLHFSFGSARNVYGLVELVGTLTLFTYSNYNMFNVYGVMVAHFKMHLFK